MSNLSRENLPKLSIVIGRQISSARKAIGMTQSDLSKKLNCSLQTVHRWEIGRTTPDANEIGKIAEITKKNIDYFFPKETEEIVLQQKILAISRSLNLRNLELTKEIIDALENPLAVKALLATHKIDKQSGKAMEKALEILAGMSPDKLEAFLKLIH